MTFTTSDKGTVLLRALTPADHDQLFAYLNQLGDKTQKRFGPHPFDLPSILRFYENPDHCGYLAIDESGNIVAYAIIKLGYLEHDRFRLHSYGMNPNHQTDSTFAPSVADAWQSCGVGQALLAYILDQLKATGRKRLFLWGGVQADNVKALNFYLKNGFEMLGAFEYNGNNFDMMCVL